MVEKTSLVRVQSDLFRFQRFCDFCKKSNRKTDNTSIVGYTIAARRQNQILLDPGKKWRCQNVLNGRPEVLNLSLITYPLEILSQTMILFAHISFAQFN